MSTCEGWKEHWLVRWEQGFKLSILWRKDCWQCSSRPLDLTFLMNKITSSVKKQKWNLDIIIQTSSPFRDSFHRSYHIHQCQNTLTEYENLHLFSTIHPSIINHLSVVGSQRQQFQQDAPDFPLPGHISQLWLGNPEVFPGQCRDIISPPGPGAALGPPPSWTCLEPLHREAARRHPYQMLNHLSWFLSTQRSSSSAPSSSQMTKLLTLLLRETPATHLRKPISAACIWILFFRSWPSFMTTGEGRNEDWAKDLKLCLLAPLPFCHNGVVKRMQNCSRCTNSPPTDLKYGNTQ